MPFAVLSVHPLCALFTIADFADLLLLAVGDRIEMVKSISAPILFINGDDDSLSKADAQDFVDAAQSVNSYFSFTCADS